MMQKERFRIVAATCLVWTVCLSSCAGLNIKTWFLDGVREASLIRKDASGAILERRTFVESDGYLCYSPVDDEAWRNRMEALSQCCKASQ